MKRALIAWMCLSIAGCAATTPPKHVEPDHTPAPMDAPSPTTPESPVAHPERKSAMLELFPGVRMDAQAGVVEVDGRVATDVHDPQTPDVYLELIVCTPDTREYESLVVINATAAQVHAALLLLGLEPGHPGGWLRQNGRVEPVEPQGDAVRVWLGLDAGDQRRAVAPEQWIKVQQQDGTFAACEPFAFVFAGSGFRTFEGVERYMGDVEGTVVGLTTFGTEVVAPRTLHNPDSALETPTLMARNDAIPAVGTPVTVRFERLTDRSAPAP